MARAGSSTTYQIRKNTKQTVKIGLFILAFTVLLSTSEIRSQDSVYKLDVAAGSSVGVLNSFGRVTARGVSAREGEPAIVPTVTVTSVDGGQTEAVRISQRGGRLTVTVAPSNKQKRVDLTLVLPARVKLRVETTTGAIEAAGDFAVVEARTGTGTIVADVPLLDLKYQFTWTESRPRVVADFELEKIDEKSGGRFELKGRYRTNAVTEVAVEEETTLEGSASKDNKKKEQKRLETVSLDFSTARGIILINVPPNEVTSDLRERPLTNAAKSIIKSGDSLLMEAIRRASPKYFGDYARTLPPYSREPSFAKKPVGAPDAGAPVKTAVVRVTDAKNRAIVGLTASDFEVTENSVQREILSVRRSAAPFNLVLLLDVSGSVENYVNFIRKVARNFVSTVDERDRISIVTFNDDVNVLSGFTTDKGKLFESLDSFDAGGGTAYYDALAFTIAESLRPMKGERTAIVILTDGDDNRSFLAFDSLIGSIQESGALIYPLYVPSGLIGLAAAGNDVDPLRKKYMSLTAKSEGEGERLAKVSGGIYYPITDVAQIQTAYDDISRQLRSAYEITFRSTAGSTDPRLKVRAKRENSFTIVTETRAGN